MGRPGKKILLVDDEPLILRVLSRWLVQRGYVTYEARGSREALQVFREEQPFHALLSDVRLEMDNGWKLAEQIAALQPSIRILMLTGTVLHDKPEMPFDYELLFKPFYPQEVLTALEKME
jgi:CheY-like chemotaxis protein